MGFVLIKDDKVKSDREGPNCSSNSESVYSLKSASATATLKQPLDTWEIVCCTGKSKMRLSQHSH